MTRLDGLTSGLLLLVDNRFLLCLFIGVSLVLYGGSTLFLADIDGHDDEQVVIERVGFELTQAMTVETIGDDGTVTLGGDGAFVRAYQSTIPATFTYEYDRTLDTVDRVLLMVDLQVERTYGGTTLWRYETPLVNDSITAPGHTHVHTSPVHLDIDRIERLAERLDDRYGTTAGTLEVSVLASVQVTDARVHVHTAELSIAFDEEVIVVEHDGIRHYEAVTGGSTGSQTWVLTVALGTGILLGLVGLRLTGVLPMSSAARSRHRMRWLHTRHPSRYVEVSTPISIRHGIVVDEHAELHTLARTHRTPILLDNRGTAAVVIDGTWYMHHTPAGD